MKVSNHKTYMLLALATAVGLLFHGSSFLSTLEDTYDIYVHIFFADHYSKSWFEPWENRWYTGFNMISYPPLAHQLIALLSFFTGLKFGAYLLALAIILLYVTGAYRFAKILSINDRAAGYAALSAVFLPSVIEALHVFGQLPTVLGIGWLLHALPEIYLYVRHGKTRHFINSISIIAVAVCSHHVTPIFGMVFFVLPLMGTAIMDGAKERLGSYDKISLIEFLQQFRVNFRRIVVFGVSTVLVTILVILPYWIWSKNDPISQVPIPHGSRDNFLEVMSSGLVFFIIPWGFILFLFPFLFYRFFSRRNLFFGLSFTMLCILGTGGTTGVPKFLLGETAFSILTLERFTFWATIMAIPFIGEFLWRLIEGDLYQNIVTTYSKLVHQILVGLLILVVFISSAFTTNLGYFRPIQPEPIDVNPIVNFLQSDQHYKWRYLTLGFGDQMAWVSANTNALTIDGNYHSARRVPELTTRAIERLENAKYRGTEGIGTLQQFLTYPQKFHLKYILSNDHFYDPALYFSGWHRVKRLSNNIIVWERADIPPLPTVLPKSLVPQYQKIIWGVIPILTLLIAFFFNVQLHWINHISSSKKFRFSYSNPEKGKHSTPFILALFLKVWMVLMFCITSWLLLDVYALNQKQSSPQRVLESYYDAVDFKEFERAHAYLNPKSNVSLDLFLLQTSLTNGLVDSYGKLNSINTQILEATSNTAKVEVTLEWVTPIDIHKKIEIHTTTRINGTWYLDPPPFSNDIPVNQFFKHNSTSFFNQGRRSVTIEQSLHKDVLDRPEVEVRDLRLISNKGIYSIIGLIQNLDEYPADLTLKALLLDKEGKLVTASYDQYFLKHKLLPKEVTPFRIDFRDIQWLTSQDLVQSKLQDKDDYRFSLEALASATSQDLYGATVVTDLATGKTSIRGRVFNQGQREITISQLLTSYFDKEQQIIWVDHQFIDKSIASRKSRSFQIARPEMGDLKLISSHADMILVNGVSKTVSKKVSDTEQRSYGLNKITLNWGSISTVRLTLNNYLGNPAPF